MRLIHFFGAITCILLWSSCRKDFEFDSIQNTKSLSFSTDTVFLDTIFSKITTSTHLLKVFNKSDNDISIPMVRLERGVSSQYQLSVNGLPLEGSPITATSGKEFRDVEILAKDSIFVFIEATVNLDNAAIKNSLTPESKYTDKIIFEGLDTNLNAKIDLITLVNDAQFIFDTDPKREFVTKQRDNQGEFIRLKGFNLKDSELIMDNSKANVIFGYAVVPTGKTLIVNKGSRLHFHSDSGLIIENGATIEINGEPSPDPENNLENEVIIEGDRIAEDFDNLPAQWGFIWIQKGAVASFSNTTIKNATTGIIIDGNGDEIAPSLTLKNTQIYNSQTTGIQATATNILGENVAINRSGQTSLNIEQGGTYNFTHSTIVNFLNAENAIQINNTPNTENIVADNNLEAANFTNCIVTGASRTVLDLVNSNSDKFNFNFTNCLINFSDSRIDISVTPQYDFDNIALYTNCIFNEDPKFKKATINQLQIDDNGSAANGKAIILNGKDITNTDRSITAPDIGAYESTLFK